MRRLAFRSKQARIGKVDRYSGKKRRKKTEKAQR
jgi:hypothetical protein